MLQEQMVVYVVSLEECMQLATKLELLWVSIVDFSEETRGVEVRNGFYFALPAFDEGFDVLSFYFINDIQQKRKLAELREPFRSWLALICLNRSAAAFMVPAVRRSRGTYKLAR